MKFYTQQLDYTIESVEDRMELVKTLLNDEDSKDLAIFMARGNRKAQNVVEKMANYVLFAYKNNKKIKKEFQIKTKHNSYRRKKEDSLDQLMEKPTFDETKVKPLVRSVYTKPKEKITERDLAASPALLEMREEIEYFELILKFNKEKEEYGLPPNVPKLDGYMMYKWQHMCIQMRRSQYLLKDSVHPRTFSKAHLMPTYHGPKLVNTTAKDDVVDDANILTINLGNKKHIYALLNAYSRVVGDVATDLNSDMKYVYWELEEYVEKANLDVSRQFILIRKIDGYDNVDIAAALQEYLGLDYSPNYISTIWKHEICSDIADAAKLAALEWEYKDVPSKWKTCRHCGERKLKNYVNFGKKSSSPDGYNNKCKVCLHKERMLKKYS